MKSDEINYTKPLAFIFVLGLLTFILHSCVTVPSANEQKIKLWNETDAIEQIHNLQFGYKAGSISCNQQMSSLQQELENIREIELQVVKEKQIARFEVCLLGANNDAISVFSFANRQYLQFDDVWYSNETDNFPSDIIEKTFTSMINQKTPRTNLAFYLEVPKDFPYPQFEDFSLITSNGYQCFYRDILQMSIDLAMTQCGLTPGNVDADRKKHVAQIGALSGLMSLFDQLYDELFHLESNLDQTHHHLLTKMKEVPAEAYRDHIINTPNINQMQCGFDISVLDYDELLQKTDNFVRVRVSKGSTSFYRRDRWPHFFANDDTWINSSFIFEVMESYYGDLVVGDVGELVYFGGVVNGVLVDCAGLYEEYFLRDEMLLLLKAEESILYTTASNVQMFREVHFYHDSLMKIDEYNLIKQIKEKRWTTYLNSNIDADELAQYLTQSLKMVR